MHTTGQAKLPNEKLKFGATFTDHMLEIDWDASKGWAAPSISPYHKFELDPAASVFHYALECFEGMKAYLDDEGSIRLFRPEMNMRRMAKSMARLGFPELDQDAYLECNKELLKLEKDWIPRGEGFSLYIRPTAISTHPFLGVDRASQVKLYTILSPVGPYYPEGFKPVTLYADKANVRAWPGGTGDTKIGPNYAPTIYPQMRAMQKGYSQVLWLFGDKDGGYVTEVGTMNIFVLMKNEAGETELVTPPLDGTILPGVTRDSILELARSWGDFGVSERLFTISELTRAIQEGRLLEAFGAGTAAVVSPIRRIHFDGVDYDVPLDPSDPNAGAGPVTKRFWDTITGIQYGRIPHEWSQKLD